MKVFAQSASEYDADNAELARWVLLLAITLLLYPFTLLIATWLHEVITTRGWSRSADALWTMSLLASTLLSGASFILAFRAPRNRFVVVATAGMATLINLLAFLSAAISD